MISCSGAAAQTPDYTRAANNYRAVVSGAKRLSDFPANEQAEVLAIARLIARQAPAGSSSECRQAREDAESKRDELANTATRLQRCAESSDLSDDCSSETRRTRNAQSDFESAISDVRNVCP
jgi:hypothetical protein